MIHTPVCDLLRIRHRIVLGGMAGGTSVPLVAAVSNAGGLGTLGIARTRAEQIPKDISAIRDTTKGPFGVNFLLFAAREPTRSCFALIASSTDGEHAMPQMARTLLGMQPTRAKPADLPVEQPTTFERHADELGGDPADIELHAAADHGLVMLALRPLSARVGQIRGRAMVRFSSR